MARRELGRVPELETQCVSVCPGWIRIGGWVMIWLRSLSLTAGEPPHCWRLGRGQWPRRSLLQTSETPLPCPWWAATSVPCPHLVPLLGTSSGYAHWHYQSQSAGYFRVVCQEGSDALLLRGGSRDISLISSSSLTCILPERQDSNTQKSRLDRHHGTCLSIRLHKHAHYRTSNIREQ